VTVSFFSAISSVISAKLKFSDGEFHLSVNIFVCSYSLSFSKNIQALVLRQFADFLQPSLVFFTIVID